MLCYYFSIIIGNPITYLGASLTWNGRQLTSYNGTVDGKATNVKYTYNANGLRGSKTVTEDSKTTAYNYYYVGGQLRYETRGNLKFYYFYDESGNLSAIRYYDANGVAHAYFALTNHQGNVVAFYNNNGVHVASYEYDAWGNCTIAKDTDGIAALNPIRYRGYYYDTETELYYLQSRYYNPKVGRFLNADGYITTGQGVMSYNMFAYCGNNPVMYSDPTGCFWKAAKKWVADKWDKFTTWCSEKLSPQHDVPLYNQGNTNLCWACSQTMVEDSLTGTTRTQLGADERARAIALEAQQETGSAEWNVAGFPRNTTPNTQIANPSMLDLTIALIDSPVYARYGNAMEGHYVVVTGVDIKKQTVFVNNPWGISGEQTYEDFLNGFVGMPDNGDFTLSFIWDAA